MGARADRDTAAQNDEAPVSAQPAGASNVRAPEGDVDQPSGLDAKG